jgi:hypothetical protein
MNRKKAKLVKQVEAKKSSPFIIFLIIALLGLMFYGIYCTPSGCNSSLDICDSCLLFKMLTLAIGAMGLIVMVLVINGGQEDEKV